MTSFEPVQAGPYLAPSDPPDLANISKAIVDWAATRIVMRFASSTARAAAIPAPTEGMVSWLNDTNRLYGYNGTTWMLVGLLDDTGWITATLAAGWTGVAGNLPVYRRMNGITYLSGTAASTGGVPAAFTLPVGFRRALALTQYLDGGAVQVRSMVSVNGDVGQTNAAVVAGLNFGGLSPYPAV